MTDEEFNAYVEAQWKRCTDTFRAKCPEYADTAGDRLSAFKAAADLQGVGTLQAITGMMAKHTVSVYKLAREESRDLDLWREKITDHINYLLMLEAVVELELEAVDE